MHPTYSSMSAIYKGWARQGKKISRRNAYAVITQWHALRAAGALPPLWEEESDGDGALRMYQHVGKPGRMRRVLQKMDPQKPHGPDNTYWGSNGLTSRDPEYQKAHHAWVVGKSKDQGFRLVFKNFGTFLSIVGAPPAYDGREKRLAFGKINTLEPWTKTNVKYELVDRDVERTTKENAALIRQRAYAAYKRAPAGAWTDFEDFIQEVGLPPNNERWALVSKSSDGVIRKGSAHWVFRGKRFSVSKIEPIPNLTERQCLALAKSIHDRLARRITKLEAWEIATSIRSSIFMEAYKKRHEELADEERELDERANGECSDQGQPPTPAPRWASGDASPGSAAGTSAGPVIAGPDLATALSFLVTAVGSENPLVRSAVDFVLSRVDTQPAAVDEALVVLQKYRTAIQVARQS